MVTSAIRALRARTSAIGRMEIKHEIENLLSEVTRLRRLLQEGRRLTAPEYRRLKSQIEAMMLDLELNYGQGKEQK